MRIDICDEVERWKYIFKNGPNGSINMTAVPKKMFIMPGRNQGKTLAMEFYKRFCENMEENNMNNNNNKINKRYTPNIYAVINGKMYAPESISMRHEYRQDPEYEFHVTVDPFHALDNPMLTINNVIFNPPATIVFWSDGSKTVVKRQGREEFDPEKGLTMAFFKKMHGNRGRYFDQIKKWTEKYEEERPKIKPIDWSAIATALNHHFEVECMHNKEFRSNYLKKRKEDSQK